MKTPLKVIVTGGLIVLMLGACSRVGTQTTSRPADQPTAPQQTEQPANPAPETPAPTNVNLGAGQYTAGTDIPAGIYDLTVVSGSGNFIAKTGSMGISEMMGTDPAYYIQSYKNANLKNGTEFKIMGNVVINFTSH